jgi:hydroxypyruvate isomerase
LSVERTEQLLKEIDSPHLGVCLRIGAQDAAALAPLAIHVQATASSFDTLGRADDVNYLTHLDALNATNYTGWISIRYEGSGEPTQGIMQTAELVSALTT